MRLRIGVLIFSILLFIQGSVFVCAQERPQIEFKSVELTDASGQKVQAEMGKLRVPENRRNSSSKLIELTVVRLKSRSEKPGSPIFYLAGGPGGSAIGEARFPFMRALIERLRDTHDIILMDQRGTGRSNPLVMWASPSSMPPEAFLSQEKMVELLRSWGAQAIESFKQRGIDLAGYSTVESADDIDDLRKALGAEKISLIGFSYGTHLGLDIIRRHSTHLNSVVLVGTEGPGHTLKPPSHYDAQLRKLSDLAAEDPNIRNKVPDMVALLRRVLDKLEKQPAIIKVRDSRTRQMVDVPVGKFGLQMIVRIDVGDGNDFPEFPLLFYTIDRGDYSVLQKYVEKRYNQFGQGISGMSTMMDLYSGATAERLARIRKEAQTSILGNTMNFPDMYISDLWGNPDLGDEYRGLLVSNVRTLFISGTLDCNTPPYQAEELRWGFSNGSHIIVEYAGHEDTLPNPQVQAAIIDFFDGKDVSGVRISLGKPRFKPIP
jgi:pimeloyl-ACP methyl ester carboxylesterase